jgi:hypothetical protein
MMRLSGPRGNEVIRKATEVAMRPNIRLGQVFGIEIGLQYSWQIIALLIMFSLAAHFEAANRGMAVPGRLVARANHGNCCSS